MKTNLNIEFETIHSCHALSANKASKFARLQAVKEAGRQEARQRRKYQEEQEFLGEIAEATNARRNNKRL